MRRDKEHSYPIYAVGNVPFHGLPYKPDNQELCEFANPSHASSFPICSVQYTKRLSSRTMWHEAAIACDSVGSSFPEVRFVGSLWKIETVHEQDDQTCRQLFSRIYFQRHFIENISPPCVFSPARLHIRLWRPPPAKSLAKISKGFKSGVWNSTQSRKSRKRPLL